MEHSVKEASPWGEAVAQATDEGGVNLLLPIRRYLSFPKPLTLYRGSKPR